MRTEQPRPSIEPGMSRREYRALIAAWERDQAMADGPAQPVAAVATARPSAAPEPDSTISSFGSGGDNAHTAPAIDYDVAPQIAPVHTATAPIAVEYDSYYEPSTATYDLSQQSHDDYQVGFEDYASVPAIPTAYDGTTPALETGWGSIVAFDLSGYVVTDSLRVVSLDSRRDRRASTKTAIPTWLVGQAPRVGLVGALGVAAVVAPLALAGGVGDAHKQTVLDNTTDASGVGKPGHDSGMGHLPDVSAKMPALNSKAGQSDESRLAAEKAFSQAAAQKAAQQAARDEAAKQAALQAAREAEEQARQLEQERQRAAEEKASRDRARNPLPGCSGQAPANSGANGLLKLSTLCKLPQSGHRLRADAAVDFARLNDAYKARFGVDIPITDSYRSLAAQRSLKRRKPRLAATPGTSNHGWGLALDLGGRIPSRGKEYYWLRKNAPKFGWDNPHWARRGGSGPYEPWHWEYKAAK